MKRVSLRENQRLQPVQSIGARLRVHRAVSSMARESDAGEPDDSDEILGCVVAADTLWGAKIRFAPRESVICRQDADFGTPQVDVAA